MQPRNFTSGFPDGRLHATRADRLADEKCRIKKAASECGLY
ncbi:hypothetical protein Pvag_pPag30301 (plasmid) [Pantoea vagans C9-1]|nr:hypothetical protein Pvag_pPag30301 [Pantoea vagans C9-1]